MDLNFKLEYVKFRIQSISDLNIGLAIIFLLQILCVFDESLDSVQLLLLVI